MRYWQMFVLGGYYWSKAQTRREMHSYCDQTLALGLECRAGPGNGLRKINILIIFLTGTKKEKSCLRSPRGYI